MFLIFISAKQKIKLFTVFICLEYARATKLIEVKRMTNFERIKQMSVDEMAEYICIELPHCPIQAMHCKDTDCVNCFKKWLESEAEDNE